MSGVAIDDRMNVEMRRHGFVDLAQEAQEFLVSMTRLAGAEHCTGKNIQGRKQCCGPMALIVVSDTFDIAQAHGQHGLRAFKRVALALLVNAYHQRIIRRVQVQTRDVSQLIDEERIGGKLKALGAMRLYAKEGQIALNAALGDPGGGFEIAHTPLCCATARPLMQRGVDSATRSSLIVRGLPGRSSSYRPAIPPCVRIVVAPIESINRGR